jgi:pimeloyl-[acyl-carrier protein] synthase
MSTAVLDFLDPAFADDPYPVLASLRDGHALVDDAFGLSKIVLRYDDVDRVLKDRQVGVISYESFSGGAETIPPLLEFLSNQILGQDPPEHTRVRRLVNTGFSARHMENMRGRIRGMLTDRISTAAASGRLELIRDVALPVPVQVICELLGVDTADQADFQLWSEQLARAFGPSPNPDAIEQANGAVVSLRAYIEGLIAEQRARPREGLLGDLITAEAEGDRLSHAELVYNTLLLLFAGHETTKNLIANGMLLLLRHPEQLARLRSDPTLLDPAVEEMLRYDPPVGLVGRRTLADIEIAGHALPADTRLGVCIMSANRDPARFPDPDRFDIGRTDNRHLSFGVGRHYCLGGPLARIEAQEAFRVLLDLLAEIELDGPVTRQESFVLRGLDALPLSVRPR